MNKKLQIFIGVAIIIRIALSALPSFQVDMGAWLGWAARLNEFGPSGFYSESTWTQYTPGYLYFLWAISKLGLANEFVIKLSVVLADIATALLIRRIVSKKSNRWADLTFWIYVLNPVVIFTGSVWGQIDGIMTFFMLLSFYFFNKKRWIESGVFWGIAFLIKPQSMILLPGIFYLALVDRRKIKELVAYFGFSALVVILTLSFPFFPEDPLFGIFRIVEKMTAYYAYTSVFAFNFWSLVGMWQKDSITFLGLSYYVWGILMFLASTCAIFWKFRKLVKEEHTKYLVAGLVLLSAFLFPTRVHERYLFPTFAFLLVSAGLSKSKLILASFSFLSVLNFLNLYHPYAYYSENFLKNESLIKLTGDLSKLIAALSLSLFSLIVFFRKHGERVLGSIVQLVKSLKFEKRIQKAVGENNAFPKISLSNEKARYFLILILAFSFFTRIYSLASPAQEYFDEVYHAFTARQMLQGNVKAWEWWNTPPEGFAYEWTHPPMAKIGMILGMLIFGENSFGWRVPGAVLGVVSVYLVYLLAKRIFKDELLGLLAAGVFSLDGLVLVISRIGMNDIYFLTFALASLYFYLKNSNILSAVFLGLSFSSKWSAMWLVPIFVAAHFVFSKKIKRSYLAFLILPPLIYLASYLPFFLQGHTFSQFFNVNAITKCFGQIPCDQAYGVQQQMWWYHTNLNATHSYTSPWYTWPLMVRPVYLYTSQVVSDYVSRIYLIGNPLVFWGGAVGVLLSSYFAFTRRNYKLGFIVLAYLFFFVPWALSPRIMFLYHYLPSIPFMAIALAYGLRKHPRVIVYFIVPSVLMFLYFYPHWAGLSIPEWLDASYYWFSSWR